MPQFDHMQDEAAVVQRLMALDENNNNREQGGNVEEDLLENEFGWHFRYVVCGWCCYMVFLCLCVSVCLCVCCYVLFAIGCCKVTSACVSSPLRPTHVIQPQPPG